MPPKAVPHVLMNASLPRLALLGGGGNVRRQSMWEVSKHWASPQKLWLILFLSQSPTYCEESTGTSTTGS